MSESGKEFRARIRAQRQEMNRVQAASDLSDLKDIGKGCLWAVVGIAVIVLLITVFA